MKSGTQYLGNIPAFFVPINARPEYVSKVRARLDAWGLKATPIVRVPNLTEGSHGVIPCVERAVVEPNVIDEAIENHKARHSPEFKSAMKYVHTQYNKALAALAKS